MFSQIPELDAPLLNQLIDSGENKLKIVDVREISEMAKGIIPGAVAMPLASLPARIHELSAEEDIVIVCRSGARSAQACMFLAQRGFKNTYNLRGGMMAWAQHGFVATRPEMVSA